MEDILSQIDKLAELAEQERSAPVISTGDMVTFTGEQGEMTGQVESIDNDMANVRIMALAGDSMEPTDDVEVVPVDQLTLKNAPDTDPEPGNDDDEQEEALEKGAYVAWQSMEGHTIGRVISMADCIIHPETGEEFKSDKHDLALVEVYIGNNEYEATGVHVVRKYAECEVIQPPALKMGRLMLKMKNYDTTTEEKVGIIEGIASSYGNVDLGGDTVQKGAYTQTLNHNKSQFNLMFDHGFGVKDVAGVAYAEDTEEGLKIRGEMPIHIKSVEEGHQKIKFMAERGQPIGLSIGYYPVKSAPGPNGTRILKEIALDEISITPYPMDTFARIRDAKSRKISYHLKRSKWQHIPDAPVGNQITEVDWKSLCDQLTETQQIIRNHNG